MTRKSPNQPAISAFLGFPETLDYEMELEGHGVVNLELVLDRHMDLPKRKKEQKRPWADGVSKNKYSETLISPMEF